MSRATNKTDMIKMAEDNYAKLCTVIEGMTEEELATPFDFSQDTKKKEAHWARDENLRDVLIHLYEWHQLLLRWTASNMHGQPQPFLLPPYNWKTYGEMNVVFWQKHRDTSLASAKNMLLQSHLEVLALAEGLSNEQLFSKGVYDWVGGSALGSYFISVTASHYDWAIKKLVAHKKNCLTG